MNMCKYQYSRICLRTAMKSEEAAGCGGDVGFALLPPPPPGIFSLSAALTRSAARFIDVSMANDQTASRRAIRAK